jgi:hypothetical protein
VQPPPAVRAAASLVITTPESETSAIAATLPVSMSWIVVAL